MGWFSVAHAEIDQADTTGFKEILVQYNMAKDMLVSNRFDDSKKLFTQLAKKYENTDFAPFCYYYAAYSHYKAGTLKDANFLLFQLIAKFSSWDKIDLAYYLKGIIQFEVRNYPDAFIQFNRVSARNMREEVLKAKYQYCQGLSEDSLRLLMSKFPTEDVLKQFLLLKRGRPMPKNSNGSVLNVAVLLPFESSAKNQFIPELYTGIRLAADSLMKTGIEVNLIPFETDKDSTKIIEFTKLNDAGNFDLIIGPLYTSQQKWIADFAEREDILVVNPLSGFSSNALKPNNFLFLPSYETQGIKAARFAFENFTRRKTAVVIFSPNPGDTIMARAYKNEFERLGGKVLIYRSLKQSTAGYFGAIFSRVPIDTVGHVFIANNEPSLAANIFTYLEGRLLERASKYGESMGTLEKSSRRLSPADIPIIAPHEWLENQAINYDQFILHNTHFVYPEFVNEDSLCSSFIRNYYKKVSMPPTTFAFQGYELMLYFGKAMDKFGKKLWKNPEELKLSKGYAMPYVDYAEPLGNQFVPIVKIEDYRLKLMNKPSDF